MSASRSSARSYAVQALYQWQVGRQPPAQIVLQFAEGGLGQADPEFFKELLYGVSGNVARLDQALGEFTDRPVDEVDPVERAIIRLGAFELLFRPDVPYRVVINECINLAKRFGATDGHKYVNGILDKVARKQRKPETGMERGGKV